MMVSEHINYLQPKTMQELQEGLHGLSEKSVILAGGTDMMVHIRDMKPHIDTYLSLCKLKEMQGISEQDGWIRIGAMTTHAEAASDDKVKRYFNALSSACRRVGSQQIRNKGTIGGNLMNANPAGDVLPCIMLFGGEIETFSANGAYKRISIDKFPTETGKASLGRQEVLSAIWLPIDCNKKSCFVKLGSRTEVTIAQISLCLSWKKTDDKYDSIEAYMGAVDTRPLKIEEAQAALGNNPFSAENMDAFSEMLSEKIRAIRMNRKHESKLKILECEKLYKERAVKGVVYDAVACMRY